MRRFDIALLLLVIFLTVFGILMIYNASSVIALRDFGDKFHYFKDQLIWLLIGYTALIFLSFIDYHWLFALAVPILVITIIILFGVFIPGIGVYTLGAHRWINLHFFVLQPAELIKLSLAIYLSAWFSNKEKERFLAFCMLIGLVLLLIILQPDMGTAGVVLFEGLIMYYLSGGSIWHFMALVPVIAISGIVLIGMAPYRLARLTAFLQMDKSLDNTSYHVKQALIALGSGGIFGVGLGNSLQKYEYLPENVTDSIFAIIAEELGFIGASVLIIIFFIIIWRGFLISFRAKDKFGKLLAASIVSFLGIQFLINLASMTALIPLTGIPLPFISYGGSALVIDLSSIGILLNISKQGSMSNA
jgi:cell division protein FtsW